jgi:hypothetical protein
MKTGWYIMLLSQIGNVGAHQIQKIKNQPEEGYITEGDALIALQIQIKDKTIFCYSWDSLTILKLYQL